mmetsp:Transcript_22964/g.74818  ORF Transcript_22964/g.74818 Transcript_22964/m.74818 type:complete len:260 (-) Transcript_22964:128-907(-)
MGKKGGKKKKGKDAEPTEPAHDPGWERAVESGRWDRPAEALPDASQWPTWGALRERVLTASKEVVITYTASLRDAFPAELVKLSPPELSKLELRGSSNLNRFVLSPVTSCPKLVHLDLSSCQMLNFVLLQSASLETVSLARSPVLTKALVQCKNMRSLKVEGCEGLQTLMVWSDQLKELDLSTCSSLTEVKLYCPELYDDNVKMPKVKKATEAPPQKYGPIHEMLEQNYDYKLKAEEAAKATRMLASTSGSIPRTFYLC